MASTVQDTIRDEIADIRFSQRKLDAAKQGKGPLAAYRPEQRQVLVEAEHRYIDFCRERINRLFKSRHGVKPNKYGYFE